MTNETTTTTNTNNEEANKRLAGTCGGHVETAQEKARREHILAKKEE